MPDQHHHNRREDFRVDDVLYMREEPLSAAEFEARQKHPGMPSRLSSALLGMLPKNVDVEQLLQHGDASNDLVRAIEALDDKLNYLISVSMLNEAERHSLHERTVDISSTGMSFSSEIAYEVDQPLQVDLVVPTSPPQMMELLGEVKWVRQEDDRPKVGISFCFRSMEERETLARYVYRRHREIIRVQEEISA